MATIDDLQGADPGLYLSKGGGGGRPHRDTWNERQI